MVPTLVKLEPVTVDFNVVPVKVPASAVAVMIISALPSNATPLIFFVAANLVAVAALPVEFNFKSNAVCVAVETGLFASLVLSTLSNPKFVLAAAVVVAPVPPLAMAIEVPLQVPLVIVPTVVKLDKDVNVVFVVAVIFPAVIAVVAVVALPVVF